MALASLDDINAHLPQDRVPMRQGMDGLLQISAERTIRGYLSGFITAVTMQQWADPEDTPQLIREIAGKFIAASWYRQRMAAEVADDTPDYAQDLYDEAWATLRSIRASETTLDELTDDDYVTDVSELTEAMFWPNTTSDPPKFTMSLFD